MGTKEITLDWDIEFETVRNSISWQMLKKFCLSEGIGVSIKDVLMRKSSHGNTHIKIELHDEIDILSEFEYRALLRDDRNRIRLDLIRLLDKRSDISRLWDFKFDGEEILKTGDWIEITSWNQII